MTYNGATDAIVAYLAAAWPDWTEAERITAGLCMYVLSTIEVGWPFGVRMRAAQGKIAYR